jgi:hypothetical protein
MATIGVLNLLATADVTGLTKGIGKARTEIVSIGATVEQARSKMAGLVAGVGAALGIGSMTAWVKGSMDAINSTRVLGERLGTSSEALSRLSYAAKIADVDQETLTGSLQKMEKSLAEVAMTGEGKAASALDRIGISAAELTAQDPVDTFHRLVGAMEQIQNPAERMKAATDIFGKGAAGILNLVVQGSAGIAQLEAEADKLGVTFNDLDAAKVDEADDAMTAVWESVSGVGKALAVELAPWITEAATRFTDWAKSGVNTGNMVTSAIDWVTNAMGYLGDVVQVSKAGFYGFAAVVQEGFSYILSGIDKAIQGFSFLYEKLTGTKLAVTDFFGEWSKVYESSAVQNLDKMGAVWGKEWAHNTVRAFTDEITLGAETRAIQAVAKAQKFRGGLGDDIDMVGKHSISTKAMTLGSAEAANTILNTKFGGGGGKDIASVAKNTNEGNQLLKNIYTAIKENPGLTDLEIMDKM